MKPIIIVLFVSLFSITLHGQVKDTLSVPAGTTAVKIGKDVYELKKVTPGIFSLEFNAEAYNQLVLLLEQSTGSHQDVETMKRFFKQQLVAKGLIQESPPPPKR